MASVFHGISKIIKRTPNTCRYVLFCDPIIPHVLPSTDNALQAGIMRSPGFACVYYHLGIVQVWSRLERTLYPQRFCNLLCYSKIIT